MYLYLWLEAVFPPEKVDYIVALSSADSCRNTHIYTGYIPTQ